MPELPEVETVKTKLQPLVGRRFAGVQVLYDKAVRAPSPEELRRKIAGQRIKEIARRGKYLLVRLDSGQTLVLHLKMTGWLSLQAAGSELPPYTRNFFEFDDGSRLYFVDRRKLGRIWLIDDETVATGKMGPEPFSPEFTPEVFAAMLKKRTIPVKAVLLDQGLLAGVGNMYADEALFAAKIHPLRPANDLSKKEVKRLYDAILQVLAQGIRNQGASVSTYLLPDGAKGSAHLEFQVAHRGGKSCPKCGTPIERIAIRGRGSYFCPKCQAK